jgi:hypothetical protein
MFNEAKMVAESKESSLEGRIRADDLLVITNEALSLTK